ncbi:hypothetical protein E4U41_002341 [Claviceps citrina]|nr:hypothetical protein E4U41_002341 [Claviceps citrina]
MGLVDYDSDSGSGSGSGSGSEAARPIKPASKSSQASAKKPFRKVVDRANPGKIVVSLPTQAPPRSDISHGNGEEPPAKRARTTGGGGLFAGFNSLLPAPKNTGRHAIKPSASSTTRPGVNLRTSAAPGFSRDGGEVEGTWTAETSVGGGLSLPPPKRQEATPSIPEGQKSAEEVKLVGKPLLFRPLSVDLNAKKKKKKTKPGSDPSPAAQHSASSSTQSSAATGHSAPAPEKKRVSLFSMHIEEPADAAAPVSPPAYDGAYEPLFGTVHGDEAGESSAGYSTPADGQHGAGVAKTAEGSESLDHIADDLNLSAAARRELFGRDGSHFAAKKVVSFNMDREYQHNEHVRASGDQQMHQPVRALQGGKHSLKQLIQNVQNQKDALEDSFAKGRSNRKEASSRYGW